MSGPHRIPPQALRAVAGGVLPPRQDDPPLILPGSPADDLLEGGAGFETMVGGDGADTLLGREGNDMIFADVGRDIADGGAGEDTLITGIGSDVLIGGEGNDTFISRPKMQFDDGPNQPTRDFDLMEGGAGDDTFIVTAPRDGASITELALISGGEGTDTVVLETNGHAEAYRAALVAELARAGLSFSEGPDGAILLAPGQAAAVGSPAFNFIAAGIERIVLR
jgi:Ca2+-binding RTX toxin-like protein